MQHEASIRTSPVTMFIEGKLRDAFVLDMSLCRAWEKKIASKPLRWVVWAGKKDKKERQ
jgi:hypothetical protein